MIRKIVVITILLLSVNAVFGQTLQSYKATLARANTDGASVRITEMGDAARLINSVPAGNPDQMVEGYRVEIFSDNTSAARAQAFETYAKFKELYPGIPADDQKDVVYISPKYTVRIGYFLTHEEAIIMCGRLKSHFKAYPRNERLPLSVFTQQHVIQEQAVPSQQEPNSF